MRLLPLAGGHVVVLAVVGLGVAIVERYGHALSSLLFVGRGVFREIGSLVGEGVEGVDACTQVVG